ncbi:MAG TPA: HAD hydrolase-like protein [Terriglobales bacterium]|nr:HAD hydrolase-like protein [Terriglobales bacterium]
MTQTSAAWERRDGDRWKDADAYLFDIDGTLLVARDLVHYQALNRALAEVYGVDTTIDGVAYHGKTDLGILRAALERVGVRGPVFEAKLGQALDFVCRDVSRHAQGMRPEICRGVDEVLARLKAAGKLLGIASGNLEVVGWHKVKAAKLDRFFEFGFFCDHHESRADIFARGVAEVKGRLGEGASVCFVGDTPEDIKAARQVNAQIIAVSTGIFPAEELLSLHPDVCVTSCADLVDLPGGPAAQLAPPPAAKAP